MLVTSILRFNAIFVAEFVAHNFEIAAKEDIVAKKKDHS
jgi:hypothetical protein